MSVKDIYGRVCLFMLLLVFSFTTFMPLPAGAQAEQDIAVFINGEEIVFDTPPVIENGRTMVPLRAIAEGMGMTVKWNNEAQQVIAEKAGESGLMKITLQIGSASAEVEKGNQATIQSLDAAPFIRDDHTFLPLRFMAESMELQVDWDADSRIVTIITSGEPEITPAPDITVTTNKMGSSTDIIEIGLKIPVINGMADQNIQETLNSRFADDALTFRDQLAALAAQDSQQMSEEYFRKYGAYTDYEVKYNRNGLLSITIDYYSYTGGAHGMTERVPYNIDMNTGQILSLEDIFTPGYDYVSIINAKVKAKMAAEPECYFSEDIVSFETINTNQNYYLDEQNGLVIYFSLYEIAPYAAGFPEFPIPFDNFGQGLSLILQ